MCEPARFLVCFFEKPAGLHSRAGGGQSENKTLAAFNSKTNENQNENERISYTLLIQHVKERASRTQSESSLSSFAEAKPLFEAQPQRALVNESHRKITHKKNAFQSLETHSETKFRKSVENQKLLVSNFLPVRN